MTSLGAAPETSWIKIRKRRSSAWLRTSAFGSRPAAPDRIHYAQVRNAVLRAKEALRLQDGPDLEDFRGRGEAEC
jgi:hypothetical protein